MNGKRPHVATLVAIGLGVCVLVFAIMFFVLTRAEESPVVPLPAGGGKGTSPNEPALPLPQHNPMAARIALEKAKRPDLKNKPSGPELIKAQVKRLQIPEEDLATLPTNDLLRKVVTSPLVGFEMFLDEYPDGGLDRTTKSFNGMNGFLSRPDAAKVLLSEYNRLYDLIAAAREPDPFHVKIIELDTAKRYDELDKLTKDTPWEKHAFRFTIMEVLMTSEQIMDQLKDKDRRIGVVSSIVKCLDAQKRFDSLHPAPVFGKGPRLFSALAIGKYLEALDAPEYKKWYTGKREAGLFVNRGATGQESEEIIKMGREYVRQQAGK